MNRSDSLNNLTDNGTQKQGEAADGPHVQAMRLSRHQALRERVLVAAPDAIAKEASFKVPVALSCSAWDECVAWHGDGTQDEEGRLWDVLWMALNAIRRRKSKTDNASFVVYRIANGETTPTPVDLQIVVGPGDQGEAVLTIYLANEA